MKSHPYRNSEALHAIGANVGECHSIRERGMHAVNARPPPAVPYRRYPSLSDDGQPWFPRLRSARRNSAENVSDTNPVNEKDGSFFSVRVFALLAIVVIIAALVASA